MTDMRLKNYFTQADRHIEMIDDALEVLSPKIPIENYASLDRLEKFALNTLIFRFSKLQDLIGSKIFRNYLDFSGFDISEKSFYQILSEIEKEGIVDIDIWNEMRELRNKIAHEYPEDIDETIESINLFIDKSNILVDISLILEKNIMRLQKRETKIIKEVVKKIFGSETEVYLFGSRINDEKKGGDIDLFIVADKPSYENKIKALAGLKRELHKSVDIVLHRNYDRDIEQEAIKGIKL